MRVMIIGGGIAGLCLAHGLRQRGVSVKVYERGPPCADPDWLQGYQIHVNPDGAHALQECLSPPVWAKLISNACVPSAAFQVLTENMHQVAIVEAELMNGSSHVPIVRATLRRVLLDALGDVVEFGKDFARYESAMHGVTALFTDGTRAVGDILVGADGTGSNVRKQYLPHARIEDTGIVGAACRLPLTTSRQSQLPDHLLNRLTSIVPSERDYMIVTQSIYKAGADHVGDDLGDHLIWVFISRRSAYGAADPRAMDGESIKQLVLDRMSGWHPILRELVAESEAAQIAAVPVLTSAPIQPWEPSIVTLIGDAIHTMTPLQGLGGSTALRDAGVLCRKLDEANRGNLRLLGAVGDYELEMRGYGFHAVRRSAQFGRLAASDSWVVRKAFKTLLQLTRIPAVKGWVFRPVNWS